MLPSLSVQQGTNKTSTMWNNKLGPNSTNALYLPVKVLNN